MRRAGQGKLLLAPTNLTRLGHEKALPIKQGPNSAFMLNSSSSQIPRNSTICTVSDRSAYFYLIRLREYLEP